MAIPTLFTIAQADLKSAIRLVDSNDKFQKHQAAYFTQQSIEKTIKYLIQLHTGTFPWGHDIAKLVKEASKYNIYIPSLVIKNANTYTDWEVVSRYYPRKVIRRDSIKNVINEVKKWHKDLKLRGYS